MRVLIVDDEFEVANSLKRIISRENILDISIANSGIDGMNLIRNKNFDVVFLDLMLPDINGMEILEKVKPVSPSTEFIILTAIDDIKSAVKAIKLGAYDYLVKPADSNRIIITLQRAFERKALREGIKSFQKYESQDTIDEAFESIITNSKKMIDIFNYAKILSKSGNPIMITGESGTGKELMARALHKLIRGYNAPFVAFNITSIPEQLFESQLFGHSEGAFTGATKSFPGYIRMANGGTLFLDEIGELPQSQQIKLLRFLEDKFIIPIGETKPIPIDIQVISATNVNIEEAVRNGKFRLDLFYRLNACHLKLPPLRERDNDIEVLSKHFVNVFARKYNKKIEGISSSALKYLNKNNYPGNIRELNQKIEKAVLLCDSDEISCKDLGIEENNISERKWLSLKENSNKYYIEVLEYTNWNKRKAADILGVTLRQVQRKVVELSEDPYWKNLIKK